MVYVRVLEDPGRETKKLNEAIDNVELFRGLLDEAMALNGLKGTPNIFKVFNDEFKKIADEAVLSSIGKQK